MHRLVLLILLLPRLAGAATYYLSPSGQDSAAGTAAQAPWKTFSYALPQLQPGDTLLLLDGVYTRADSGMLQVQCASVTRGESYLGKESEPPLPRGRPGRAASVVRVLAQHPRQVHIQSDGAQQALRLVGCAYWVIQGIFFSSQDNTTAQSSDGSVGLLEGSDHVTIRDNVFAYTNRYYNSHLLSVNYKNSDHLLEGNELYASNRHGILLYADGPQNMPERITVRRNYLNSRNYGSIPGGWTSGTVPDRGATAISCYPCKESLFENNIAENWDAGFDMQCKFDCTNNRYLGNINKDTAFSVGANSRREVLGSTDPRIMPTNTLYKDHVSLAADRPNSILGIFRANKNAQFQQVSLLDSVNQLYYADNNGQDVGDNQPSLHGTNILARNVPTSGFVISQSGGWSLDHVLVYQVAGSSPALSDSHYTNVQQHDPVLGGCLVWIPQGSPAQGAGANGADIGASILFRYEGGTLTQTPLWHPQTGQFPCGPVVPGLNDVAGASCTNVHQRLGVGVAGCPLPYQGGGGTVVSWQAPTEGGAPSTYQVWRAVGSESPALLATVPPTQQTYTDSAAPAGACYAVSAKNPYGETPSSAVCAQATGEPPGAPQDVSVTQGVKGVRR